MSILIRGMEMPNVCAYCFLDASECDLHAKVNIWRERHPDCPLVEIPTPHGRLIDADKIEYEKLYIDDVGKSYEMVGKDDIDELPTVIEAEGSEE